MQTITTKYKNGNITAKCWNGSVRVQSDCGLSSEENHRAAAEKLIAKLNKNKSVSWGIVVSAPAVGDGWTFIIDYMPEVKPLNMTITVVFKPCTNTQAAYMKAYSWLFPRGVKVNYAAWPGVDWHSTEGCAKYAAGVMLDMVNEECKKTGITGYKLGDYGQLPNDDRVFMLIPE